jgi:hypothetical protein
MRILLLKLRLQKIPDSDGDKHQCHRYIPEADDAFLGTQLPFEEKSMVFVVVASL